VNRRAIPDAGAGRTSAAHRARPIPSHSTAGTPADAPAAYPPYGDYGHGRIDVEVDTGRVSAAHPAHYRQRGAVLAVSLIFLLLLSIVAISLMRSGQLEVLMAGNAQSRLSAFEMAEGITEAIMVRWEDNFESNAIVCSAGHPNTDGKCDESNLMWDLRLNPAENHSSLLPQAKGAQVTARVRPLNDGKDTCPPPEFMPGDYEVDTPVLLFEVEAAFDLVQLRQGASRVHRGAALRGAGECAAEPKSAGNLDQFAHLRY